MLTTMVSTNAHALSEQMVRYDGLFDDPVVDAGLYGIGALYRLYQTARGWVFLAVTTEREWSDLSRGLSAHVDLAGDPRFATPPGRQDEGAALAEALDAVFRTRPAAEWERNLAEFDVACVEVDERPCELVLMADEMWRAAGLVVDVVHPTLDEHPRLGPLVQFSRSETVSGAAPLLGQDTDAVLAELGYSQSRIDDLRSRGVIL
jgi:crotonobetainyl-CoA:carnitine CoA-transferase CaiB-like acyl-CoA transferase